MVRAEWIAYSDTHKENFGTSGGTDPKQLRDIDIFDEALFTCPEDLIPLMWFFTLLLWPGRTSPSETPIWSFALRCVYFQMA